MLLARFLGGAIHAGDLRLIDARKREYRFGDGTGTPVTIRLHDHDLHLRLVLNPHLAVGEAYMDGTLTVDDGNLYGFLETVAANMANFERHPLQAATRRLGRWLRYAQQHNPVGKARENVAHHYDLSDELYALFLDSDRQYSCAYFSTPHGDLERAQDDKKRHIAAKLLLDRPDLRVLDIGSGWGGLGLYLASESNADVTGVTLSVEQHRVSNESAAAAGFAGRVRFALRDYREETGRYDRIVSVGMFEHVGAGHYDEYFARLRDLLADDGVCLLHSIGRMEPPGTTNAWLRKYIFPGGYTPALSEVLAAVERQGLYVTDIEILRLHYAETLRVWRERFMAARDRAAALYDERFCRMWEFYLAGCEVAFRHMGQMVFQMQLALRQDAVPLTRDYITDWERAHTPAAAASRAAE
ncbi:MAG: class I SAM-dependent methyltransferase [Alphaproteobacteria bacterium]|nr:class I SAM-dependent methyltransferase [Alphaproteobacteria bacterium]